MPFQDQVGDIIFGRARFPHRSRNQPNLAYAPVGEMCPIEDRFCPRTDMDLVDLGGRATVQRMSFGGSLSALEVEGHITARRVDGFASGLFALNQAHLMERAQVVVQ